MTTARERIAGRRLRQVRVSSPFEGGEGPARKVDLPSPDDIDYLLKLARPSGPGLLHLVGPQSSNWDTGFALVFDPTASEADIGLTSPWRGYVSPYFF